MKDDTFKEDKAVFKKTKKQKRNNSLDRKQHPSQDE